MTTVIDPLGTPSVIFNRSGTSIMTIAAGLVTSPTANDAPEIPSVCGHMIVLVSTIFRQGLDDSFVIRLPADAEIGDGIEVYPQAATAIPLALPAKVLVPVGNTLYNPTLPTAVGQNNDPGYHVSAGGGTAPGVLFRKVSSTNWQLVGAI